VPADSSISRSREIAKIVLVAAVYFVSGLAGLSVPFTSFNVSPVWPPAGVTLAALLILGPRVWPGILLGAFLVNYLTSISPVASLGIATGSTAGMLAAAFLLKRSGFNVSLPRLRDVLKFCCLGAVLPTMIAATFGVGSLFLTGSQPWSSFGIAWLVWWVGDTMGVLILAPVILSLYSLGLRRLLKLEMLALLVLTAATCLFIFDTNLLFRIAEGVIALVVFPFVVWGAIRFGIRGAALASLAVATVSVAETAANSGPFVTFSALRNSMLLQLFLAVTTVTGLVLAAVTTELQSAQDALQREKRLVRERDVAERERDRLYTDLETERALLQAVLRHMPAGVIIADALSGKVVLGNPVADEIFPATPSISSLLELAFHADGTAYQSAELPLERSIRSGEVIAREEVRVRRGDGAWSFLEISSAPVRNLSGEIVAGVLLFNDVSKRKRAEAALRESERLAAAGRMAAAIAHEINNPLEALTNLLYLVGRDTSLGVRARELTGMAEQEVARVGHVARQTLAFYRENSTPGLLDITEILDGILSLYTPRIARRGVEVVRKYELQQGIVAIAGELRQVFSNLLVNALDAVPPGGRVIVHAFESRDWRNLGVRGVRVVIADNGPGIAQEISRKIFEPFFTTKGERGTGLGLWVAKGIISKHRGSITVATSTRPGRAGACFSVFLPGDGASAIESRTGMSQKTTAPSD
jgi:PAS domain S-box-containing protein